MFACNEGRRNCVSCDQRIARTVHGDAVAFIRAAPAKIGCPGQNAAVADFGHEGIVSTTGTVVFADKIRRTCYACYQRVACAIHGDPARDIPGAEDEDAAFGSRAASAKIGCPGQCTAAGYFGHENVGKVALPGKLLFAPPKSVEYVQPVTIALPVLSSAMPLP